MSPFPFTTLADALPLDKPSGDIHFLAHLVPIKKANRPITSSPVGQFTTSISRDKSRMMLDVYGQEKSYFTWNGAREFEKAEFKIILSSSAPMMVNNQRLARGVPVVLHDQDTLQIFEFSQSQPNFDIPTYCAKFFFRKEHVLCSKRQKTHEVINFAGQGGYGTVHKCRNPDGEQRLAVKLWALVPRKTDPHIVALRDAWMYNNSQYIAMDMALGDLHHLICDRGCRNGSVVLTEAEVKSLARQIFEGLHFIHSSGYVHCDIKPANILLYGCHAESRDPHSHAVIGDFGLAGTHTKLKSSAARGSPFVGTLGFVPPEVAHKPPIYSSLVDVWAAGISLFNAYTGMYINGTAGPGDVAQVITDHQNGQWTGLAQLKGISPAAVQFLIRCLEPDYRRMTARQALQDLWLTDTQPPFTPSVTDRAPSNLH